MQYSAVPSVFKANPGMQMEEQILAERCRRGDRAAQKELYDRYAAQLMSVCLRYAGERMMAEDLLHDAFLKIFSVIGRFTYRGPGSLRAWLERVTVNMALEWLRARNRLTCASLDDSRSSAAAEEPDAGQVSRIPREVLMRFVSELPDGYRTVFNLFCIEGRSHREIADMLGIGEKSSSSQLTRARAILARKVRAWWSEH